MRVLVVDDDPVCLNLLDEVLRAMGFDVVLAHNGQEAFDLICEGDVRIVLSDWNMPGMSGIDLCKRVRARQLSGYVYFILLTSLDREHHLVNGLNAGADDFISKPFNSSELMVRLKASRRTDQSFRLREPPSHKYFLACQTGGIA